MPGSRLPCRPGFSDFVREGGPTAERQHLSGPWLGARQGHGQATARPRPQLLIMSGLAQSVLCAWNVLSVCTCRVGRAPSLEPPAVRGLSSEAGHLPCSL